MAPPRFGGTRRGTVVVSSAQGLLKFSIRAAPLPKNIWDFLKDNLALLRRMRQERKSREESTTTEISAVEDDSEDDDIDEVDLQGEIIRRPTVRPDEFWRVFEQKCTEAGGDWVGLADKVWEFGPQGAGTCLLLDARTEGQPPNSCESLYPRVWTPLTQR